MLSFILLLTSFGTVSQDAAVSRSNYERIKWKKKDKSRIPSSSKRDQGISKTIT